MASDATARVEGDALHLAGTLDRAAVVALWPQLVRQAGQSRRLDLQAVERVDSAGLALLLAPLQLSATVRRRAPRGCGRKSNPCWRAFPGRAVRRWADAS